MKEERREKKQQSQRHNKAPQEEGRRRKEEEVVDRFPQSLIAPFIKLAKIGKVHRCSANDHC